MNKIKFVNPLVTKDEHKNLNQAFKSGWLSDGPYVEKFEKKLSKIMGTKFGISVNNGTSFIANIDSRRMFHKLTNTSPHEIVNS